MKFDYDPFKPPPEWAWTNVTKYVDGLLVEMERAGVATRVKARSNSSDGSLNRNDYMFNPFAVKSAADTARLAEITNERKSEQMRCLEEAGFVDRQTRLVQIEMALANYDSQQFAVAVAYFEFSPGGAVIPHFRVYPAIVPRITCMMELQKTFRPFGWPHGNCTNDACRRSHDGWLRTMATPLETMCRPSSRQAINKMEGGEAYLAGMPGFMRESVESYEYSRVPRYRVMTGSPNVTSNYHSFLFLLAFAWYFLASEVEELVDMGIRRYILSFWNIVDLASIALVILAFACDIRTKEAFPEQTMPYWVETSTRTANLKLALGGLLCLQWIKVISYLGMAEMFKSLAETLSIALPGASCFAVLLFMFFMGTLI